MTTMYSDRRHSDGENGWSSRVFIRLLLHWLMAGAVIVSIVSLFLLIRVLPGETIPILISAFALLGIGVCGFCLWALAVGMPAVRRSFYGPTPVWSRNRRQKPVAPWFDHTGKMLWQRDGRGVWVRKADVAPRLGGSAEQEPYNG